MTTRENGQRKLRWGILAGVLFCIAWAGGSLYVGVSQSPSISQWIAERRGTTPTPQMESGSSNDFILLFPYGNSTYENVYVKINYTAYGNDISVDEPVWLSANAIVEGPANNTVSVISLQPENTVGSPYGYGANLNLKPPNKSVGQKIWSGTILEEYSTAGPLVVTLQVQTTWESPDNHQKLSLGTMREVIETINLEPSGSGQIRIYERQDLSLTMFILFFAAFDIAVTLSEHIYEDVKKSKGSADKQLNETDGGCYCPY